MNDLTYFNKPELTANTGNPAGENYQHYIVPAIDNKLNSNYFV